VADNDVDRHWDAIVVHADDDVAVALRDIRCGDVVRVRRQGAVRNMTIRDAVPLGHKFALHPIAAGTEIRKYGQSIGGATAAIAEGAHVHVHNMASLRARPP
jgi:altronate dehydratase small subunit